MSIAIIILGMLAGLYYSRFSENVSSDIKPVISNSSPNLLTLEEKNRIQAITSKAVHPNMYLDKKDIEILRQKANSISWQNYSAKTIEEADSELSTEIYSVTKNGGPSNGHDYHTDCPYCGWSKIDPKLPDYRDGMINDQADREDYTAAINVSKAVSNLGLAYSITGKPVYAEKAIRLIRAWSIDPNTRMIPRFYTDQSHIELFVSLPGLFYGADLIHDFSGWDKDEKYAFKSWVKDLAAEALKFKKDNNMENWRINFLAASGAFLDDEDLLMYAFGRFREIISLQLDTDGRLITELKRTKSLSYSLFGLNALMNIAEIARHYGINLYDYTSDGTKGLKLALDFHAPHAQKSIFSNWPYQQITSLTHIDNVALYELAWTHWKDPSYAAVIQTWGRPMTDIRIHHQITLTHGSLLNN